MYRKTETDTGTIVSDKKHFRNGAIFRRNLKEGGVKIPEKNNVTGSNYRLAFLMVIVVLCSCASTVKQFYPDTFYYEDDIYENKAIGFLMTFRGKWNIITNPNDMNKHYKAFARTMQNAGGELLFMGSTVEELYGVKALALNLNEPSGDYAQYIRTLNHTEIDSDTTPVDFFTENIHMVKWIYSKAGYRFVEFFFNVDTYNIRLSFWTKPELFTNFLAVFEEIAGTIMLTSGF